MALAYLGKLAYDVKRDVDNLFEWLDGVVDKKAIVEKLGNIGGNLFEFVNVVRAIRKLLPVSRRPVFDFLVRLVSRDEFVSKAEIRYCSDSKYSSLLSSGNNKLVSNYSDIFEEKLDD